jgi:hypothetical protein
VLTDYWRLRPYAPPSASLTHHLLAYTPPSASLIHHLRCLCPTLCCAAGELLDTPPPGVDEAIAIAKVIQFLKVGACCWNQLVPIVSTEEGVSRCLLLVQSRV